MFYAMCALDLVCLYMFCVLGDGTAESGNRSLSATVLHRAKKRRDSLALFRRCRELLSFSQWLPLQTTTLR